jgi:hypothetical protein
VTRRRGRRRKKLLDDLKRRERILSSEGGGFNPLNAELNTIRHLLALVGVHHFVDVSRIRVKSHYVAGIVLEEALGTCRYTDY